MALAALLALTTVLAAAPASADKGHEAPKAKAEAATTIAVNGDSDDDIPASAPKDDYRFVAWCFGAMQESINVYATIIPELKAIDARIGSPVKEDVPYANDVEEEKLALKRFAAAMEAAERASPQPIAPQGAAAMDLGRSIWARAKEQTPRQLADAWLQWGSPDKCEVVAKNLKARATLLGQAMAIGAPTVDAPTTAPAPAPDATATPQPAAATGDAPAQAPAQAPPEAPAPTNFPQTPPAATPDAPPPAPAQP